MEDRMQIKNDEDPRAAKLGPEKVKKPSEISQNGVFIVFFVGILGLFAGFFVALLPWIYFRFLNNDPMWVLFWIGITAGLFLGPYLLNLCMHSCSRLFVPSSPGDDNTGNG